MGAAALPAAIGLQVTGAVFGAYSAERAGLAQEGYYRYLASTAETNARLAEITGEQQARTVQDVAAQEFARLGRGVRRVEGAQRAAGAAAGISGSVTAEDIARDTEATARLEEMAIRFNADTQSAEILRQAGLSAFNLRSEAAGFRAAGSQARAAGKRAFLSSLIGGAASAAGTFALASRTTDIGPSPVRPNIRKQFGVPRGFRTRYRGFV